MYTSVGATYVSAAPAASRTRWSASVLRPVLPTTPPRSADEAALRMMAQMDCPVFYRKECIDKDALPFFSAAMVGAPPPAEGVEALTWKAFTEKVRRCGVFSKPLCPDVDAAIRGALPAGCLAPESVRLREYIAAYPTGNGPNPPMNQAVVVAKKSAGFMADLSGRAVCGAAAPPPAPAPSSPAPRYIDSRDAAAPAPAPYDDGAVPYDGGPAGGGYAAAEKTDYRALYVIGGVAAIAAVGLVFLAKKKRGTEA